MSIPASLPPCSILLLAGGRGQRMGGRDKGLVQWHGKPLIAYLHALVRPLSDDLIISCNRNGERYAAYADRLVEDDERDFPGPFAGIRAGLRAARHAHMLVLPCDAPLIDRPLLDEMRRCATRAPSLPLMVKRGSQWEPLFCLLPISLGPALEQAWQAGERSPGKVLRALGAQALPYAEDDPRFANLNTPELLEAEPPSPPNAKTCL